MELFNGMCVPQIHQSEKEPVPQPGDLSEEAEESQCCNFNVFAEEEGYEADSESNPDDSDSKDEGKPEL